MSTTPPLDTTQKQPAITIGSVSVPLIVLQWVIKDVPLLIVVGILTWFVIVQEAHIKDLQSTADANRSGLQGVLRELTIISDTLRSYGYAIPRTSGEQP